MTLLWAAVDQRARLSEVTELSNTNPVRDVAPLVRQERGAGLAPLHRIDGRFLGVVILQ